MTSIRLLLLFGAANVLSIYGFSQAGQDGVQSPSHQSFDVVSIRPMKEDDSTPTHITNSTRSGYIKAVNVNVKALVEVAYDIPDTRMFGGPTWIRTMKFSLEAKADPRVDKEIASLSPQQGTQLKRKMLADLLAERFKVVVHLETRELPVYVMTVAKGGPRLDVMKSGDGSLSASDDRIDIRAGKDSLEVLAYELSWRLGRPVLDRTGLKDRQALMLRWQDESATTTDSNAPSLFTAIQEQLGLKLESSRGPVPVLLIDHVEKPAEN